MSFQIPSYDKDWSLKSLESLAEARGSFVGQTILAHAMDGTPLLDQAGEQGTHELWPYTQDLTEALYGMNWSVSERRVVYRSVHAGLWIAKKLKSNTDTPVKGMYKVDLSDPDHVRATMEHDVEAYWGGARSLRALAALSLRTITAERELYHDAETIVGCTLRGIDRYYAEHLQSNE